jgi:hypothetical protein
MTEAYHRPRPEIWVAFKLDTEEDVAAFLRLCEAHSGLIRFSVLDCKRRHLVARLLPGGAEEGGR